MSTALAGAARPTARPAMALALLIALLPALATAQQPAALAAGFKIPDAPPKCTLAMRQKIDWGVAASAYQIEGAWNESGKGPSIWDEFVRLPGIVVNNATGDVADDHYHRFKSDVALMKSLDANGYRLSIAWTRIVPTGERGSAINYAGIAFYKALILDLLAQGITPAVTLYHWDLPAPLQKKYKGFESAELQDDFLFYADVVFKHLGPLVTDWMTFNEPLSICQLGYDYGVFAPGTKGGPKGQYVCGHNLLLAHARTVQMYRQKYAAAQGGRIGIALDGKWGSPFNPKSPADVAAAQYWMEFQYGWMADPVYFGDYPKIMRDTQGDALPKFTPEQSKLLKGSMDFFGVNFYCGYFVKAPDAGSPPDVVYNVTYVGPNGEPPGEPSNLPWLFKTPKDFGKTLVWLHERYDGPEFKITENGVSGPGENTKPLPAVLDDTFRQSYYFGYLDSMCDAIATKGVKITVYYAWSLMDNFEWREGYSSQFGIVYVDYKDNLKRVPKVSALWFQKHFFSLRKNTPFASLLATLSRKFSGVFGKLGA